MVSSLDSSSQRFLRSTAQLLQRIETAQRRLGSGKLVERASDAPDRVSDVLRLRGQIVRNATVKQNLTRVKTEVDTGEKTLSDAVTALERAAVVGTQGTSSAQTVATRAALATEVEDIMKQMVGYSNTAIDGRYIFAGDNDQTAPFALDWTADTGVQALVADTTPTREIENPDGTTFVPSLGGGQIFDPRNEDGTAATGNAFAALQSLRSALLAGDTDGIKSAVNQVQEAGTYMNRQLSSYGVLQNRLSSALSEVETTATTLQTRLAGVEDADMTEEIVELTQGKLQLDAALQARALQPRTSLFDVL